MRKRFYAKLTAVCLSITLCGAVLAGCGSKDADSSTGAQTSTETPADDAQGDGAQTQEPDVSEPDSGAQQPETIEVTTFPLPSASEESEIFIKPIDGISDDFIRGMDASIVLAEENSGVKYYNFEGEEQDVFMTMAQAGVNYIRLRVWNDPYDENGNGYGGGNNDLATAVELGKRATMYGMKVCIDFHYSDFWADPKRQHARSMNLRKKA